MSDTIAAIRWNLHPRRIVDRARLRLAIALHDVSEAIADLACRVAPRWDGGQ